MFILYHINYIEGKYLHVSGYCQCLIIFYAWYLYIVTSNNSKIVFYCNYQLFNIY